MWDKQRNQWKRTRVSPCLLSSVCLPVCNALLFRCSRSTRFRLSFFHSTLDGLSPMSNPCSIFLMFCGTSTDSTVEKQRPYHKINQTSCLWLYDLGGLFDGLVSAFIPSFLCSTTQKIATGSFSCDDCDVIYRSSHRLSKSRGCVAEC